MMQRYAHHCSESLRDGVNVLDRDGVITNHHTLIKNQE
jgi:hypothetical protein